MLRTLMWTDESEIEELSRQQSDRLLGRVREYTRRTSLRSWSRTNLVLAVFTGARSVLLLSKAGSSRIGSSRTLEPRHAAFRCITFVLYTARRLRLFNQSTDFGIIGEHVTVVTEWTRT